MIPGIMPPNVLVPYNLKKEIAGSKCAVVDKYKLALLNATPLETLQYIARVTIFNVNAAANDNRL